MDILKDNSLAISFGKGISQSPLAENYDTLGVDFEREGVASCEFKFNKLTESDGITDKTFTYLNGRDWNFGERIFYRGQENYFAITVSSTGTLPTALAVDTIYYVRYYTTSGSDVYYRFYPTLKDAFAETNFINVSGDGTGVHTAHYIFPSTITDYTLNNNEYIFALDDNQNVWFLGKNASEPFYLVKGNTKLGVGQGIIYYKGYILVFYGVGIDALLDFSVPGVDTVTWTNGFQTGVQPTTKPFYSINDDSIYFGTGSVGSRYFRVGLLEEIDGQTFDPATATGTTFDFVIDALTLPYDSVLNAPTVITEYGEYLIIGTGGDKLYYWDKKSPSFTAFLQLPEKDIIDIKNLDNMMYIFIGNKGSIYASNLTSVQLISKIPEHLTNRYKTKITINVEDVAVFEDKLLFSVNYSTGTTTAETYIMSYDTTNGLLTKFNESADGSAVEGSGGFWGKIKKIIPQGNNVFLSTLKYDDDLGDYICNLESLLYGANVSVAKVYSFHDTYTPHIITELKSYGTFYNKLTLRKVYISLLRELETGNGIKISYRRNDSDTWTELVDADFTTYGDYKDIQIEKPITNIIDIQVKVELKGSASTTPYLKSIMLLP